jgi:hypothetical protein
VSRSALVAAAASAAAVLATGFAAGAPGQRYAAATPVIAPVPMGASCLAAAAADVDLGAAWLLVGEPDAARPAFDRAVDHDPDCALGYWGQALARFAAAEAESPDAQRAVDAAIGRALTVPARTPFERAAVVALRALRERVAAPGVPAAWPARVSAYRDTLCGGAATDRGIRVWCARALADAAASIDLPGGVPAALPHVVELARDRTLDTGTAFIALQVAPDPQAPLVTRALAAIAAADPPASGPHLAAADMAVKRGDWSAAAASSARAGAVASRADARAAALDAELEALMQLGRRRAAYARAAAAIRLPADAGDVERDAAARAVARLSVADRRIDGRGLGDRTALSLGPRESARWPAVFVDALDAALRAWPGGDEALLARARASLQTLQSLASEDSLNEADWAATIVEAAMAASQDEHQQMDVFLSHAADLERNPAMLRFGRRLLVPTREIAAELWLRTYRYDWARRDAAAVLEAQPRRVSPFVVLARTAGRVDDRAAAAQAWRTVLDLRASADADDTVRLEATQGLGATPPAGTPPRP